MAKFVLREQLKNRALPVEHKQAKAQKIFKKSNETLKVAKIKAFERDFIGHYMKRRLESRQTKQILSVCKSRSCHFRNFQRVKLSGDIPLEEIGIAIEDLVTFMIHGKDGIRCELY